MAVTPVNQSSEERYYSIGRRPTESSEPLRSSIWNPASNVPASSIDYSKDVCGGTPLSSEQIARLTLIEAQKQMEALTLCPPNQK
jgi:hypothetical protein